MVRIGSLTIQDEATVLPSIGIINISKAVDGSGSVPYTGAGFRPSWVMFLMASNNNDSASWGFDDGVNATVIQTPDNEGSPTSGAFQVEGRGSGDSLLLVDQGGGGETAGSISSMDVDGFTIAWTQVGTPTISLQARAICFK